MGLDLQKASVSKRLAAFMIDFFIFILLFSLIASLCSFIFGFGSSVEAFFDIYDKYKEKYELDDLYTQNYDEYMKLPDDVKLRYEAATEEFEKSGDAARVYELLIEIAIKAFFIISISILFSFVVTELAVPLFLKNGQTLGKKLFAIGIMRLDGVKITNFQLFVRAIVGKCIIETLIPVMFILLSFFGALGGLGYLVVALFVLVQAIMFIVTKNKYGLHDALAVTVAVDMQTQMIFNSHEELIAYKTKLHEEEVQNSPY